MNEESRLYPAEHSQRKLKSAKAKRIATCGEDLAAEFLQARAYRILLRNYRAGRSGEIDIIAMDPEQVLCFIEVKTRTVELPIYGIPEVGFEAVGYTKQRKILEVSRLFLLEAEGLHQRSWRYDVMVIAIPRTGKSQPQITHVRDAFN
ncbi:MAG: YraN family protein [Candidatus Obscuribacterales bacterium]|nr:YraN family protein [Candidatus Obscuribacterales bacterium]